MGRILGRDDPTFERLDVFTRRRRLRAFLRKQEKRPGQSVCRADHTLAQRLLRESRAVRASHGLVTGETVSMNDNFAPNTKTH